MKDINELLADFVGARNGKPSEGYKQQWTFKFCDGFWPTVDTMKFDTSFDWIIPVIRKAKEIHYKVPSGQQLYRKIELALERLDISQCVDECVRFIEAYNQHKKKHPIIAKEN